MNRAYNLVYEQRELLYSLSLNDLSLNDAALQQIGLDCFNFDNESVSDFLNYVEFMGFDVYVFVCFGPQNRIKKVIDFLKTCTKKVRFEIIESDVFLEESLNNLDDFNEGSVALVKKAYEDKLLSNSDIEQVFENGCKAYVTGMYPSQITSGVLKHLYLDDLHSFEKIDVTVLESMSVNSCIYVENSDLDHSSCFSIVREASGLDSVSCEVKTRAEIISTLEHFVESGEIYFDEALVRDYYRLLGLSRLNSLTVRDAKIYLDCGRRFELSSDLTLSNFELKNQFSDVVSGLQVKSELQTVARMFPGLTSIKRLYSSSHVVFRTAFNKGVYPANSDTGQSWTLKEWVGFETDNECFVFNFGSRRLFRVNKAFLDAFEAIVKGREDANAALRNEVWRTLNECGSKSTAVT